MAIPGAVYLDKMRQLLMEAGSFSKEQIDQLIGMARGYAGGKAKAEKMRQAKTFPYKSITDLPDNVKSVLPEAGQRIWMAAFNAAMTRYDSEERAVQIAWGAVKNAGFEKDESGNWTRASELADDAIERLITHWEESTMNLYPLVSEMTFSETEGKVQIFPPVGKYNHPKYGELDISQDFMEEIKSNFDKKVYQQELPLTIDLEHESSLSGAAGWIKDLEIRDDKGMWATVEFNDRGKTLVSEDRYRFFSPEFYDKWVDPATSEAYDNVLTGGALTNHPFFKGMDAAVLSEGKLYAFSEMGTVQLAMKTEDGNEYPAEAYLYAPDTEKPSTWKLRSLYKREDVSEDDMPKYIKGSMEVSEEDANSILREMGFDIPTQDGGEQMGMTEEEARKFTDMEATVKTLSEQLDEQKAEREKAEAEVVKANERIEKMERDSRRRILSEFVKDNRPAFQGEIEENVEKLEKLQENLPDELFQDVLEEKKAFATRIVESGLFKQESHNEQVPSTVADEFDAEVAKLVEDGMEKPQAVAKVATEKPDLYKRYDDEHKKKIRGGE